MDTDTSLSEDRAEGKERQHRPRKPPEAIRGGGRPSPKASEGAWPRRHFQLRLWPLEVQKMTDDTLPF